LELALLPDGSLYLLGDDGQWHHVPDVDTANALGVDWNALPQYDVLPGDVGDELPSIASQAPAPPPAATPVMQQPVAADQQTNATYAVGSLVGLPDQRVLMLLADGQWHWIPDTTTFNVLRLQWSAVSWVAALPGDEGVPLASAAGAVTPGDVQTSDNFQAGPLASTDSSYPPPPAPPPASPPVTGAENPAQPMPSETTPGDWNAADNMNPVQPSAGGTPVPSSDQVPAAPPTQPTDVGNLTFGPNVNVTADSPTPPGRSTPPGPVPPGAPVRFVSDDDESRAWTAYLYFLNKGLSPAGAAALVGNFLVESYWTVNPRDPRVDSGPARGIAQWLYTGRWQDLLSWAGDRDPLSLHVQLDFVWHELTTVSDYQPVKKSLQTAADPTSAAELVGRVYEGAITKGQVQDLDRRQYEARMVLFAFWRGK
jgi:hypothetical protein